MKVQTTSVIKQTQAIEGTLMLRNRHYSRHGIVLAMSLTAFATSLSAGEVKLRSLDGSVVLGGDYLSYDQDQHVLQTDLGPLFVSGALSR